MRTLLLLVFGLWLGDLHAQCAPALPVKGLSLLTPLRPFPVQHMALPAPWSYQRLGVFCKLDVQLERRMRMPVLFRLGDVQRVEAMEGKGPLRVMDLR